MTSKTLWNNFLKYEIRSRIWMYIAWALALIFTMPVILLMTIDTFRLNYYYDPTALTADVAMFLGSGYGFYGFEAVILGILTAFFCFSFVYMKSAVDLYHSLPVRRGKLFVIRYLSGALPTVILQFLASLLSFAVLAIRGCVAVITVKALLFATLQSIMTFFMAYNVAIIAIMLTGTLIVGVLGTGTLLSFTFFVTRLLQSYRSSCFQTYYFGSAESESIWHMLLNPLAIVFINAENDRLALRIVLIALELVLFFLLGMFLYRKRPSESVGKSLCHGISKHIIRIPLVILAALAGGLFVSFILTSLPTAWYWTAFAVSGILAHVVLELIFEQEVAGILRHPIQFLACLLIAGFVSVSFQYDLFGYDRYLPNREQVASVSIRLGSVENEVPHFETGEDGELQYGDYDEILKEDLFTDPGTVLNLAKAGIADLNPERSAIKRRQSQMYGSPDYDAKEKMNYVIRYRLKSGRDVYRTYNAEADSVLSDVAAVYESESYKNFIYQAGKLSAEGRIDAIEARNWEDSLAFDGTMINVNDLIAAYEKDLAARKLSDLAAYPILKLSSTDFEDYMDVMSGYYIYESDKNSVGYLKSAGIDVQTFAKRLTPDQIRQIKVYDYSRQKEDTESKVMATNSYDDSCAATYTKEENAAEIDRLCMVMVPSNLSYNNSVLHPSVNGVDLEVTYTDGNGNERIAYFLLPYGETY